MKLYAFVDENNIVKNVVSSAPPADVLNGKTPEEYYESMTGYRCLETSLDGSIRGIYAGIGFIYEETDDLFLPPKCHGEASLNIETASWVCDNEEHHGRLINRD